MPSDVSDVNCVRKKMCEEGGVGHLLTDIQEERLKSLAVIGGRLRSRCRGGDSESGSESVCEWYVEFGESVCTRCAKGFPAAGVANR